MENEVKSIQDLAATIKEDISKVETKNSAEIEKINKAVDTLAANLKVAQLGSVEKKADNLINRIEAKSADLKNFGSTKQTVEIKASVDMLRGNTGISTSQSQITAGAYVALPNRPTHVRDYMRIGKLATPVYIYDRELTPTGKPAITAEGARKPQISFNLVQVTANAAKVASNYKMSTELLHDAPAAAYSFQGRGIEMTLQEEDYQLLYGTGTSGSLQGIMPLATPFAAGTVRVANAQTIDVIRVAELQVRQSFYTANVVLMNPLDVAVLELTKDSQGRYLLPNIMSGAISTVARVQIVEIDAINPGEFLVGALDMAVDAFTVEDLVVKMSDSNEDDFVNNKVTVVIEERLLQAVVRPSALVKGTFADAKAQLGAA